GAPPGGSGWQIGGRNGGCSSEDAYEGMDQEQFGQDEKTVDAVARNLEILGEATRQLPEYFVAQFPKVPWRQMAGLRNRIVHDYFGLDLEIIWQVVRHDLPQLRSQLESL